ncbi:GNAT family acetyltransferase [Oceanicola sp. 22II-s10i]|uniref:GNAT family N-acetyltransferase n=1 Tax=Oceanicola sp. 22II-s10i TaxID=1317116 RepID=UPI000B520001|nr:GNAT family N-acetyltransferase [Oceanicola sp. 22II-s10i]OWU84104.1 GNAT family acetyltransferase [Oceanicola sp. 22II-s10i]
MTEVRVLTGPALHAALDDVARLRIEVFRAFPYLYDGDLAYERRYLESYLAPSAIVAAAFDGTRIVGAATGTAMEDHSDDFAAAFADRPEPLTEIFYCAESVLLPEYRGRGIGHAFFDAREAHARALGRRFSAFCAVSRPDTHPRRPVDYAPLDAFWRKRGCAPLPGVSARFAWRETGQINETDHTLQFWMRGL